MTKEEIQSLAYELYPDFETHEALNDEQRCLRIGFIRGYLKSQEYATQQTEAKDREIEELRERIKQLEFELESEIQGDK